MKYRLYVSGYCSDTRDLQSNMSIGGVILSNNSEREFSQMIGEGTLLESHVYAIIYGILVKFLPLSFVKTLGR